MGVIRIPAYRRLLTAYTLNELAWGVGVVALSILVYRRTGSAMGAAAFYICSQFLPALVSPLLVARTEHVPVRLVLPALYAGEAVIFAVLAVVARRIAVEAVLALTVLDGLLAMTARPIARGATVAVTRPAGLLREGNAAVSYSFSLMFMLGPAIGGVVVASGGTSAALFVNAGLFAMIALALLTSSRLPDPEISREEGKGRLRAAFAYVRGDEPLRTLFGIQVVSLVFFTITVPVEVVYALDSLHVGFAGYGALLSGWGVGAVVGSVVYTRWRRASSRALVAVGSGLLGLGMGGMAAAPVLAAALAAGCVAGVGNTIYSMAVKTAVQEQADPQWMMLTVTFTETIWQVTPGSGYVLGGLLALIDPRFALAVGAAGSVLVTVVIWRLMHPSRGFVQFAVETSSS